MCRWYKINPTSPYASVGVQSLTALNAVIKITFRFKLLNQLYKKKLPPPINNDLIIFKTILLGWKYKQEMTSLPSSCSSTGLFLLLESCEKLFIYSKFYFFFINFERLNLLSSVEVFIFAQNLCLYLHMSGHL